MPRKPADQPRRFLQSLNMSLDLLEEIAKSERPPGTTEIAVALGLSKASVHAVLTNLEARGYVQRVPGSFGYVLGQRIWELGLKASHSFDLANLVHDDLTEINRITGETAQIVSYVSPGEIVFLHRIVSTHPVKAAVPIGERAAASTTASGHILLAFQPDEEIEAVLARPLPKITPHSETDPAKLRAALDHVRRTGYAVTSGTHYLDTVSLAVPVRDRSGNVPYAIGIYGPDYRLTDKAVAAFKPKLIHVAEKLSHKLGYLPQPG
jgi:DNA-binding IclR family transcriptional regulator